MTTLRTCGFDTYCEIEDYLLAHGNEDDCDVRAFALTLDVVITDEQLQQLYWDVEDAF